MADVDSEVFESGHQLNSARANLGGLRSRKAASHHGIGSMTPWRWPAERTPITASSPWSRTQRPSMERQLASGRLPVVVSHCSPLVNTRDFRSAGAEAPVPLG